MGHHLPVDEVTTQRRRPGWLKVAIAAGVLTVGALGVATVTNDDGASGGFCPADLAMGPSGEEYHRDSSQGCRWEDDEGNFVRHG